MTPRHDFPQPCECEFAALVKRPVRPAFPVFRINRMQNYYRGTDYDRDFGKGWMG